MATDQFVDMSVFVTNSHSCKYSLFPTYSSAYEKLLIEKFSTLGQMMVDFLSAVLEIHCYYLLFVNHYDNKLLYCSFYNAR